MSVEKVHSSRLLRDVTLSCTAGGAVALLYFLATRVLSTRVKLDPWLTLPVGGVATAASLAGLQLIRKATSLIFISGHPTPGGKQTTSSPEQNASASSPTQDSSSEGHDSHSAQTVQARGDGASHGEHRSPQSLPKGGAHSSGNRQQRRAGEPLPLAPGEGLKPRKVAPQTQKREAVKNSAAEKQEPGPKEVSPEQASRHESFPDRVASLEKLSDRKKARQSKELSKEINPEFLRRCRLSPHTLRALPLLLQDHPEMLACASAVVSRKEVGRRQAQTFIKSLVPDGAGLAFCRGLARCNLDLLHPLVWAYVSDYLEALIKNSRTRRIILEAPANVLRKLDEEKPVLLDALDLEWRAVVDHLLRRPTEDNTWLAKRVIEANPELRSIFEKDLNDLASLRLRLIQFHELAETSKFGDWREGGLGETKLSDTRLTLDEVCRYARYLCRPGKPDPVIRRKQIPEMISEALQQVEAPFAKASVDGSPFSLDQMAFPKEVVRAFRSESADLFGLDEGRVSSLLLLATLAHYLKSKKAQELRAEGKLMDEVSPLLERLVNNHSAADDLDLLYAAFNREILGPELTEVLKRCNLLDAYIDHLLTPGVLLDERSDSISKLLLLGQRQENLQGLSIHLPWSRAVCQRLNVYEVMDRFAAYADISGNSHMPDVSCRALIDRLREVSEFPFGSAGFGEEAVPYGIIEQLPFEIWDRMLNQGNFSHKDLANLSVVSRMVRYAVNSSSAANRVVEEACWDMLPHNFRNATRLGALLGLPWRQLKHISDKAKSSKAKTDSEEPLVGAVESYGEYLKNFASMEKSQEQRRLTPEQVRALVENPRHLEEILLVRLCRDDAERHAQAGAAAPTVVQSVLSTLLDPDTTLLLSTTLRQIGLYALLPETLDSISTCLSSLAGRGREFDTTQVNTVRARIKVLLDAASCWADPKTLKTIMASLPAPFAGEALDEEASPQYDFARAALTVVVASDEEESDELGVDTT